MQSIPNRLIVWNVTWALFKGDSTNVVNEGRKCSRNAVRRDPKSCCAHYVAAALAFATPIHGVCRITLTKAGYKLASVTCRTIDLFRIHL